MAHKSCYTFIFITREIIPASRVVMPVGMYTILFVLQKNIILRKFEKFYSTYKKVVGFPTLNIKVGIVPRCPITPGKFISWIFLLHNGQLSLFINHTFYPMCSYPSSLTVYKYIDKVTGFLVMNRSKSGLVILLSKNQRVL